MWLGDQVVSEPDLKEKQMGLTVVPAKQDMANVYLVHKGWSEGRMSYPRGPRVGEKSRW